MWSEQVPVTGSSKLLSLRFPVEVIVNGGVEQMSVFFPTPVGEKEAVVKHCDGQEVGVIKERYEENTRKGYQLLSVCVYYFLLRSHFTINQ